MTLGQHSQDPHLSFYHFTPSGFAFETIAEIEKMGGKAVGCVGDVTAPDFGDRIVKTAVDAFGAVHIVFNNAGVGGGTTLTSTPAMWDWVMSVNVDGVINGITTFMPLLLDRDLAETVALMWPGRGEGAVPGLGAVVATLRGASRASVPALVAGRGMATSTGASQVFPLP